MRPTGLSSNDSLALQSQIRRLPEQVASFGVVRFVVALVVGLGLG